MSYLVLEAAALLFCLVGLAYQWTHSVSKKHIRWLIYTWLSACVAINGFLLLFSLVRWQDAHPATTRGHIAPALDRHLTIAGLLMLAGGAVLTFFAARRSDTERERFERPREMARRNRKIVRQSEEDWSPHGLWAKDMNWK